MEIIMSNIAIPSQMRRSSLLFSQNESNQRCEGGVCADIFQSIKEKSKEGLNCIKTALTACVRPFCKTENHPSVQLSDAHSDGPSLQTMQEEDESLLPKVLPTSSRVKTSKYDNQIILSLIDESDPVWQQKKAESQGLPSRIVDVRKLLDERSPLDPNISRRFKKLTHNSRVPVFGHGRISRPDVIASDPDSQGVRKLVLTIEIAAFFKKLAPQLVKKEDGQRIKITIHSCFSAYHLKELSKLTVEEDDFFAWQLSRAFDAEGIPAEIIGRTGFARSVMVNNDPSNFYKTVDHRHHHTGDKISVVTSNGISTFKVIEYT
jgi:hypothetical protein